MSKSEASKIIRQEMKSGRNCCQAILAAVSSEWDIPVGEEMLAVAAFFGQGMGSGCTCGALTGMVMASGLMNKYHPHPAGAKLPQQLHDQFKQAFGSTCCRVIKKKRTAIQNIGNKACIDLTGKAADILFAAWKEVLNERSPESSHSLNYNSNS